MTDIPERYVELGLRLGRHVDALVDSYYGPPELAERVAAEEPRTAAELARDAADLIDGLEGAALEDTRKAWLRAQLVGLETVARRLAGEEIPFAEEVERCYGVRPERLPEEQFEAAHQALDEALPGPGSVAERYQAWREGDPVPKDSLADVVESLRADLKERTLQLVGLPDGESVLFEYVSDEPWSAFNYYLGDLRSRIAVNTDVPMTPAFLVEVVSHETYPGHHAEHAWKEQLFVRERGRLEETISMIGTPESLVAEGIAGLAVEMALGDEEQEVTAAHISGTGVDYDPEVARTVQEAARQLEGIAANVVLMLHADGRSRDEAQAYLMRWGLASERRADQALRFYTDPVWRSYATTYSDGYRLCRAFVGGDPARFKRLLTEQLTPADLQQGP